MTDEIEVFGKLLIEEVRDQAIRSCSDLNKSKTKGNTAKRWRKLVSDDVARVVIPDCVDFTMFYLLHGFLMQTRPSPEQMSSPSQKRTWNIYFAGPLFSLNERASNRRLAKAIEAADASFKVMLPQDIKYHNSFNDKRFFAEVYRACIRGVESSHAVIALLDGPSSDDGTSYEVGYAVAKGIPVLGVRTDYRASQEMGCNLMLSRGCSALIHRPAFDEDFDGLAKDIVRKLKRILAAKTSV